MIRHPVFILARLLHNRMVTCTKHTFISVLHEHWVMIGNWTIEVLRRTVVNMIILTASIVAGPCKMIQASSLKNRNGLSEIMQTFYISHRFLNDTDHIAA